ncbi:MAG: CHAT domain-containing tetratricopeptide repeat protein [Cytophagales bacterium]
MMADNVKMAYDGTNMKKLGGSMFNLADKAFYNGKYINASSRYREGFKAFPVRSNSGFGDITREFSASSAAEMVNESALDLLNIRVYAGGLNTLGIYYHSLGNFDKANYFYERSMTIRAQKLGKTSAAFMNSLQNLALLKMDLGDFAEAEHIFSYLDKVIPQLFTQNSSHYAIFINNKAMLYANLGRNEKALEIIEEAISKGKEFLPKDYFDLERIYINQGFLYMKTGQFDKAKSSFLRAEGGMREKDFLNHPDFNDLMIYIGRFYIETNNSEALNYIESAIAGSKQRYGANHLLYAKALENKALYFLKTGRYSDAVTVYALISEIRKDQLGEENREYLQTQMKLALCQWESGNIDMASAIFRSSIDAYISLIDRLFPAFSENEKSDLWSEIKPDIYLYFSFVKHNHEKSPELLQYALNVHLRTKGLLFNSTSSMKEVILNGGDEDLISIYKEWKNAHDQLAYYYSIPLEQVKDDKIDLEALELEANELEKSLSRRSAKFSGSLEKFRDYAYEISTSLGSEEAALEIVRIETNAGRDAGKAFYLGFLLKSGNPSPVLVVIDHGDELEGRNLKLYKNKILFKLEDKESFGNYWGPFTMLTGTYKHLYISYDGVYNNVSLASLQDESGRFLLEDNNYTYLTNGKLIPELKKKDAVLKASNAVLFGNPDFGENLNVNPLPGTAVEVEQIGDLFAKSGYTVTKYTGEEASEDKIQQLQSPAILHLATHGYFFSDVKSSEGLVLGIQVDKAKNNPLLRSGLMLSDANGASEESITLKKTNGLLNAFEVMSLDLGGTELVVLSACETGKGEIVNGEGVYGLPRALQVAGAQNVIMSLWKVDDAVTQELMNSFYTKLVDGEALNEAFLFAQRTIKEKYAHPYYWGAFVLLEN